MTINFDMDGTITDLYSVKDWLPLLRSYDPAPYAEAAPLLPMKVLAVILTYMKKAGHTVNIISWGSKCSTPAYDDAVAFAKRKWLKEQMPDFTFDNIFVVPYGTPKESLASGILFDDEEKNRTEWEKVDGNKAYTPEKIFEILKKIA